MLGCDAMPLVDFCCCMYPHECCMKVCIITQNVDGLQQHAFGKQSTDSDTASAKSPSELAGLEMPSPSAATEWSHSQLIQAHGRKGLFKCLNTADKYPYVSTQSWSGVRLKRSLINRSQVHTHFKTSTKIIFYPYFNIIVG